jgi:hypothetical protein
MPENNDTKSFGKAQRVNNNFDEKGMLMSKKNITICVALIPHAGKVLNFQGMP